jgi:hypothetical protein
MLVLLRIPSHRYISHRKDSGVFMKSAVEIFRPILAKRYGSILCAAAVAAFAFSLSPATFAQTTYNPSSYACLSGGNYQAPDSISNTSASFDADSLSGVATVSCTWSGFPSYIVPAGGMTLHVNVSYGFAIGEHAGGQCGAGSATVTSNAPLTWHVVCRDNSSGLTAAVPAGTDLSTITVTGSTSTINVTNGEEYQDYLTISNIYIQ